ncbi:LytR/AlgR family response regulator transcription factor [Granulicella cerasi]|uniref:LytR/AlgR family response regulator transcription factor n=1 Tax=Granulicella cerasi TaxID=741063 RepID=A0ABW1Z9Z0_9BACT|nr:LytTR family DNA-binding domain-containing protein [Granulicella cerasi]
MKHSVLIVDDEPLARQGVALRLKAHDDLEVIGECGNGQEALAFIREHAPELVFLDIQMPLMNGIEVMRTLEGERQPFVIFLTAFDQYVMRAFEVHAIGYLLKPVDETRFNAALTHARRVLGTRSTAEFNKRLKSLWQSKDEAGVEPLDKIAIRVGKQTRLVSIDEIDWIEAQGDYAELHVGTRTHLLRESLNTLESKLNKDHFLRVHRSAIVRLNRIASVSTLPNRDCSITLRSGTSLRVSRTYSEHLRKLLRSRSVTLSKQ